MTDHDNSADAPENADLFAGMGGMAPDNDAYQSQGQQQQSLKQPDVNDDQPQPGENLDDEEAEFYFDGAPLGSPTSNEEDGLETDSALVKQLRQTIKDQRRDLREKRIQPPASPAAAAPEPITLPPKPKMEDEGIDFDPDVYQQKLAEWYETEAKVKAQQQASTQAHEALVKTFNERKASYKERSAAMKIRGFDEAEQFVASQLSDVVQTQLILHADKPELVVLALARNPELMKQAQEVTDPVKLGVLIGTIQAKAKAMPKGKTDVSGVPATPRGTGKGQLRDLDAELDKARDSGDYSRVIELKKQKKAAAKK